MIAGEDTLIEPGVQLLGKTKIGARCTIRSGSVLSDALLGDDVTVEPHCVVAQSRLDDRVIIGPFARLRPDNHLKEGARIGNFVELKKSTIGEGTKAMHLTYLGDTKIGAKSNIGAGTITCNYDGFHKFPTSIGNKVFIGSDSALVAPVRIGDGAYVAAGSTITDNVPADALAIARGRQANKPGWASKKRRELAAAEKPKKATAPQEIKTSQVCKKTALRAASQVKRTKFPAAVTLSNRAQLPSASALNTNIPNVMFRVTDCTERVHGRSTGQVDRRMQSDFATVRRA